jgi:hypothetical protein
MKNMWRVSLHEAISYELRITLGWYGGVAEGYEYLK